jgi:tetraacyldisaccharide 4'-kinase
MDSDPGPGGLPAKWAARLADRIVSRRVAARESSPDGPFVVSVGNLALGGTGKTPVVISLARGLAKAGLTGAVLTRGYGSRLKGPLAVLPDNQLAGDEARLMAAALADRDWLVIQAQERWRGLAMLTEKNLASQVLILEDGHQTAGIGRDIDIVILDAWVVENGPEGPRTKPLTGPVFPFGPWRESAKGAARAQILVLETDVEELPRGTGGQEVVTFQRRLTLRTPEGDLWQCPAGATSGVLSGIARPESFENTLAGTLDQDPVLAIRCGDHADYGPRLVREIAAAARQSQVDFVVTTAKDWIKLAPFWPADLIVVVADLDIRWGKGKTLPELVGERLTP